ncbi:MAG: hypothetical protein SGBAC_012809 [Bacillariaceae sp.]
MNNSNFDSESSIGERSFLTHNDDFLETATQYLNTTENSFRNGPRSVHDDQEQSSSTSSYNHVAAFHSPARAQHQQVYTSTPRSNDVSSISAATSIASWNSVNASSQMSTWTPSFISHYMVPWQQEEKKSSWDDEESDDGDASDTFRDEPQANFDQVSDVSVVSKKRTKKSNRKSSGLCDLLCMEVGVPLEVAYSILMLLVCLTLMCFVVGYQSEKQAEQKSSTTSSLLEVLSPVAPPTPTVAPTPMPEPTAMPSPAPTLPVTPQPTQCSENKLSVDKSCYVAGDDGILLEFEVCKSRDRDWIGIYPISTTILLDDYVEWSWSCGAKGCREHPKSNDFVINTERIVGEGLYRAYYMKYNIDGTPFATAAMSETFQISSSCL